MLARRDQRPFSQSNPAHRPVLTVDYSDHVGGLDAPIIRFGGKKEDWLELSNGILSHPFPIPDIPQEIWQRLPNWRALGDLESAARRFWNVPDTLEILPANGVSAIIVYPNNPDGRLFADSDLPTVSHLVIDESFGQPTASISMMSIASRLGAIVLKGLGKFWSLAGVRLGFAICLPETANKVRTRLGPWLVSGARFAIGAAALSDQAWARQARLILAQRANELDTVLVKHATDVIGGTNLFRLVAVCSASEFFDGLAHHPILTRIFPYPDASVRIGLHTTDANLDRIDQAPTAIR